MIFAVTRVARVEIGGRGRILRSKQNIDKILSQGKQQLNRVHVKLEGILLFRGF